MSQYFRKENNYDIFERFYGQNQKPLALWLNYYSIALWIVPWSLTFLFSCTRNSPMLELSIWPIIGCSMIISKYFVIFKYHGTTIKGFPARQSDFYYYLVAIATLVVFSMTINLLINAALSNTA
ncbi:MAG: hypothetical protein HEEMFOPI_01777 [Holosporales bacterium]